MNIYAVPPLLAVVAYIPLIGVLLANRPWQRQHWLLFLYLLPAISWSLTDFLFRSDFFILDKLIQVKIVLWLALWTGVQFVFILRYFSKAKFFTLNFAYILLGALIILEALGYVPQGINADMNGLHVQYGLWYITLAIMLFLLVSGDMYFLWRRLISTKNMEERNQITYLFIGVAFFAAFGIASFVPGGGGFPLAHVGNLALASILSVVFLKHHLVDIKFITRRAIVWIGLISVGIALYLILFLLIHSFSGITIDGSTLVLGTLAAIAITGSVYLLQGLLSRRTDRLFYRARYDYLQKLRIFLRYKLGSVLSLNELSEGLLPLLAGTLHCNHIHLLLPDPANGDFVVQFSEPNKQNVAKVRLSVDNPLLERLRR